MAVDNATILDRVRLVATNDYQQRIPATTQGGISSTMRALFDPLNREYWNQFIDILVNRIGMTIIRGDQWDNPLAAFKGARLDYGSTIQEIAPGWIRAHSYDDASESLLKLERPEAQSWYHSQNRRDKYKLSINEQELRTAFTDDYGLNNFVTKLMQTIYNSDNYDEYRIMMQLIAEYENNWGFYKQRLTAYDDATFDNKKFNEELLTQIQAYAGMLRFPSALYNAQNVDIPVFANPDELILMITPRTLAGLNVQTLANVFNLELAEIKYRTVVVDEFPIPNCDAILTTRDFFVCHDTLYQTDSFYNPDTLSNTYWLHHWAVMSVSPFVPCVCFGDFETTGVDTVTYTRTDDDMSGIVYLYAEDANGDITLVNPTIASVLGNNPHMWDSDALNKAFENVTIIDGAINDSSYLTATPPDNFYGWKFAFATVVNGSLLTNITPAEPYTGDDLTNVIGAGVYDISAQIVTAAEATSGTAIALNSATKIDQYGKLHIQKTPVQFYAPVDGIAFLQIVVNVDWTYIDPSYSAGESNVAPAVIDPLRLNIASTRANA